MIRCKNWKSKFWRPMKWLTQGWKRCANIILEMI